MLDANSERSFRVRGGVVRTRLAGKVAIVTGAGSNGPGIGNGKAAAIVYAREGARVMLVDRNLDAAEETHRMIAEDVGESSAFRADVARSNECRAMADACIERYGAIDILHNNVAIPGEPGGPVEVSEESWTEVLAVNLTSVFLTCKHVIPHMERRGGGSIVNISSLAAIRARLHRPNVGYSVTKAGIEALSREVAIQYAPKGIRSNTILIGGVFTPRIVAERPGVDVDELVTRRAARQPSGRLGDAFDTANAALFLASDEAKHVTGTTLIVDGGQSAFVAVAIVEGADGGGAAIR
jgi:NAD(P)-dependent dehydrogenase (short-subunit alcohol dehydrogenase family)